MKYETNPKQSSGRGTESGDSRIDGERKTSLATIRLLPAGERGRQTCAAISIEAFPISVPTGYADGRYENSYR